MRAFITGIAGQDGSYLSEHLLNMGYEVHGMVRRNSVAENQQYRLEHIKHDIHIYYGDMTDQTSIERILTDVKPDEIYNLAAQSHVRISFDIPQYTFQVNALGVLNLLEAYKRLCPEAKFYQASSSEMFGLSVDEDLYQRETTSMNPTSPYGCAKVSAYNLVRHYRRAHGLHACNGILFNHESPRRGSNFVTSKVVKTACQIKLGRESVLELGNISSFRDWGYSGDYVKAMHLILNHDVADDFVVSSMQARSVEDMCRVVFEYLGIYNYKDYIVQNKKYLRPEELPYLKGDSTKIRSVLGWTPTYTFETMMEEMVDHWLSVLK